VPKNAYERTPTSLGAGVGGYRHEWDGGTFSNARWKTRNVPEPPLRVCEISYSLVFGAAMQEPRVLGCSNRYTHVGRCLGRWCRLSESVALILCIITAGRGKHDYTCEIRRETYPGYDVLPWKCAMCDRPRA
jgi:hypothetical protein